MTAPSDIKARSAALALLNAVLRKHRSIDDAFDAHAAGLEPRDRAFARLLTATVLRRLGQLDAMLAGFVKRAPAEPVIDILRLGVAQLVFLDTPPHAAVATSVTLTKKDHAHAGGLVNAVLRRISEQGTQLAAAQDAARLNTPEWLWNSWTAAYGEPAARASAENHLSQPPLDLTLKDPSQAAHWAEVLGATLLPTGALRLKNEGAVRELKGFAEGAWWVQDAAAALPARILMNLLGEGTHGVIDLCAAPGGKTAQFAAAGHRVTAVDISDQRLKLLRDNLQRLSLNAEVIAADALTWRPSDLADAVLLDAPCSATGTIRRHPDLPYLKRPTDLAAFTAQQTALLTAACVMVKPGGFIFYSVCSLQPEERRRVVEAVIETGGVQRTKIPPAAVGGESQFVDHLGDLRTLPSQWPERGGLDGFYGAVLQRT